MSGGIYDSADELLFRGRLNLEKDEIDVLLLRGSYVPDASHSSVLDVVEHEVSGGGYVRKSLEKRIEREDGEQPLRLLASDVVWKDATITAKLFVLARGEDLICWGDFGSEKSSSDDTFRMSWPDGVLMLTRPRS